jgi:hypothetical protein
MAIFAILTPEEDAGLMTTLESVYPNKHLKVGHGQWLVASQGTAAEVSNALGISDGKNGTGIVVAVSGYYGRADPNVWEWIKANWVA